MNTMTDCVALFREGRLDEAIQRATDSLRDDPKDTSMRSLLAELLCVHGEFERADHQLETLAHWSPDRGEEITAWRGLVRAAQARRDVFEQGAAPELTRDATPRVRALLEALLAWRHGDSETADRYAHLESERTPWQVYVEGEPAGDVRELDDRLAGIVDVLTTEGQYLWLDVAEIASLRFAPRRRPLDGLWRPAHLTLHEGFNGRVYIPIIYPTSVSEESHLLGHSTDWEESGGAVIGLGQRCWLVGENAVPLGEIDRIEAESMSEEASEPSAEVQS